MASEIEVLERLKKNLRFEIEEEFLSILSKYKEQIELEDANLKIDECVRDLSTSVERATVKIDEDNLHPRLTGA